MRYEVGVKKKKKKKRKEKYCEESERCVLAEIQTMYKLHRQPDSVDGVGTPTEIEKVSTILYRVTICFPSRSIHMILSPSLSLSL